MPAAGSQDTSRVADVRCNGHPILVRIRDNTAGFRCFHTDALRKIDLEAVHAQGYAFQIEMAFRMRRKGFQVREVPIHFVDRRAGQSKMDGAIAREALMLVPRLRGRVKRG